MKKKKDSGFRNPYYYSFRLSESVPLPKYVRNMLWFEGAGTKEQNNSPATTPEIGPFVLTLVVPIIACIFLIIPITNGFGESFFQEMGFWPTAFFLFVAYFSIAFWIFYTSLYSRARLRYGRFEAILPNLGSPNTSTEFIGVESKLPDHVIEDGIQKLKAIVHHLEHNRRHWLILNSLVMAFGFYMIIEHTDVLTGYFWIGAQIILFELIALSVLFFKKSKMDLLKENPYWPTYAKAIQYPVGKEVVKTVAINRYERGGE